MATHAHSIPAPAQQPELRPYIVYDRLPDGCLAHILREATCPMLHQGEIVVVDTSDRFLATGDLFLMESGRSNPNGPTRHVVEFELRDRCIPDGHGEFRDAPCWSALFYGEMFALDGSSRQAVRWFDGPVRPANAHYFEDRIVGRVVGILEPRFAEPTLVGRAH